MLSSNGGPVSLRQKTIKTSVSLSGTGLFTGTKVNLRICPADVDQGIVFQRIDLPSKPKIAANIAFVRETPRCTILGNEEVVIQTVEHILAAINAYGIDNLLIEIDGPEIPIFDGSSFPFTEMIEKAGVCEQAKEKLIRRITKPVYWSQGNIQLIALPSEEYRISYTLHYPHSSIIGSQFYSVLVNEHQFKNAIANSRTFSLYEEIAPLIEKGLIKGGGLENAVVIKDNTIVNPEGVRYPDEMVRHKILDMIGDLSLVAMPFLGHIIAIRSGHASNTAFARELVNYFTTEKS